MCKKGSKIHLEDIVVIQVRGNDGLNYRESEQRKCAVPVDILKMEEMFIWSFN